MALHVISAVIWVGGDVTLTTLGIVFERRGDGPTLAALGKMGTWVGTRVYTPALFAVLAFGIAVMEKGNYDWWGVFWIDFALAGWLVAGCVGVGFVGPELGRIDKAAQEFGPTSAEVGAARQAPLHDLPLRHGAAHPDRDRHGRQAVVLKEGQTAAQCGRTARARASATAVRQPRGEVVPVAVEAVGVVARRLRRLRLEPAHAPLLLRL